MDQENKCDAEEKRRLRVKCICRAFRDDFENDVNEKLEHIDDNFMEFIDIKFSLTDDCFTALIIYRI